MQQVNFTGADRIALVLALSRATLTPFTRADWAGYADAMGNAHMVRFHPDDNEHFNKVLGIGHWDPATTDVILDEGGVTWNSMSPVNCHAYCVTVSLDVDPNGTDPGLPDEYWQYNMRGQPSVEAVLCNLPEPQRAIVLACPPQARVYVIAGMLREQPTVEHANPPLVRPANTQGSYLEAFADLHGNLLRRKPD